METMQAAVFDGPGQVGLRDRPVPHAGPGEIVLAVEATTICGTDVRLLRGEKSMRSDTVMGHEIAGRIAEVGEGVTGYPVGRQATVGIVLACGTCAACLADREHLCATLRLIGYDVDGGLAPFCRIPAEAVARGNVVLTQREIPATHLALAEPLSCCLNGLDQYRVAVGDTVVVLGAGPIGLMHVQLARLAGAGQIIVSNRGAGRRAIAKRLGATRTVDPSTEDVGAVVRDLTGGSGADVVIVAIGRPELADQALGLAGMGGRVSLFAGFPKGATAQIDPNLVHYHELVVTGGSNARRRDVARAVRLLESGAFDAETLVTHTFPLDRLMDALAAVEQRAGLKVALTL